MTDSGRLLFCNYLPLTITLLENREFCAFQRFNPEGSDPTRGIERAAAELAEWRERIPDILIRARDLTADTRSSSPVALDELAAELDFVQEMERSAFDDKAKGDRLSLTHKVS